MAADAPSRKPLRIALACGGTGGHIFPGLATADVLQQRGHHVTLWLAGKDVETPAVQGWSGAVITVPAQGLPTGWSPRVVAALWRLWRARATCIACMRAAPPDVLLAMGSYASVGPVTAALRLQTPVVLHEANVLPGRAIRLLARWARAVAASFEETRYYLRRRQPVVTGMPIRRELAEACQRLPRPEPGAPWTLMVLGGSRGAHQLNMAATEAVCRLRAQGVPLRVTHLTGAADEGAVAAAYQEAGVEHVVHPFTADVAPLYAAAHLALCRSGASTCAELLAFGVPALLVPYPHATGNHQMANAQALVKLGAADVVSERNLTVAWLVDYLASCFRTPERLTRMSTAARAHGAANGAAALADLVERVGWERS